MPCSGYAALVNGKVGPDISSAVLGMWFPSGNDIVYTLTVRIAGPYMVKASSIVPELCDRAMVKCTVAMQMLKRYLQK